MLGFGRGDGRGGVCGEHTRRRTGADTVAGPQATEGCLQVNDFKIGVP